MFHKLNNGQPTGPAPTLGQGSLRQRIAEQANYSSYIESATEHPISTGGNTSPPAAVGTNMGVAEIPLLKISIRRGMAQYADVTALVTSDGAPISSTGTGSWGQLYAAGRMP